MARFEIGLTTTAGLLTAILYALVAAGCSQQAPESSTAESQASAAEPDLAARLAGRQFAFSLSDSPRVKAAVAQRCESEGDAAACLAEVEKEAAGEGVRFETDAAGKLVFVSFGREGGREVVFHRVATRIVESSGDSITLSPDGPVTGTLAEKRPLPEGQRMVVRIEAHRIAMNDPVKGELVYRED